MKKKLSLSEKWGQLVIKAGLVNSNPPQPNFNITEEEIVRLKKLTLQ